MAHVVAVSDVEPLAIARALDRLPGARGFHCAEQLFKEAKPTVVSICTWPQSHADLVSAAASAGVVGILCEKPLALTVGEATRMVAQCRARGVKLAGGHQYRFHPLFVRAAEIIARGDLGSDLRVTGDIQSTLANNGPHLFDSVRFLLGTRAAHSITCRCVRLGDTVNRGWPAEEAAAGQCLFDDGATFDFRTGESAESFFRIQVAGSRGALELTPQILKRDGITVAIGHADDMQRCRRRQFRELLKWLDGRRDDYAADGEQSLNSVELVLAAYEAARLGSTVELPLVNQGDVIRQLFATTRQPATGCDQGDEGKSRAPLLPQDPRLAINGGARSVTKWFSARAAIGCSELWEVAKVIRRGHLNSVDGNAVPALECEFASLYNAPRAVASTSGTAALHVALAAVNLEPCDEVITTPMSDMGSVIPILWCNCVPVFADIDPLTGNLTAESIAARITPRTRAVILVHLFGRPADLAAIKQLCRSRGLILIEDCSQAHFAEYDGTKVGTFGDLGCFSLQQAKQITCGDGGLTLINRDDLGKRASLFVDKGWDRGGGLRSHQFLGMNYRMTELQGAVALAQLKRLPGLVARRRIAADELLRSLANVAGVCLPEMSPRVVSAWWKVNLAVDDVLVSRRDLLVSLLQAEGIKISGQYLPRPLFDEPVICDRNTYGRSGFPLSAVEYRTPDIADFPGLRDFFRRQLILPWSSHANLSHANEIARAFQKVFHAVEEAHVTKSLDPVAPLKYAIRP